MGKDKADNAGFSELLRKGRANGILLEEISGRQVKEIESRANTYERGLFSPATAMGNPTLMLGAIKKGSVIEDVPMHCGIRYLLSPDGCAMTPQGAYHVGYVVNAVALCADRIALGYGFANRYWIPPPIHEVVLLFE